MNSFKILFMCMASIIVFKGVCDAKELKIRSYKDIELYFEQEGFTQENWLLGDREVPNFTFEDVGDRWRNVAVPKIDVATKKNIFFRALAPFGIKANMSVMEERNKLLDLINLNSRTVVDETWLKNLAIKYKVVEKETVKITKQNLEELLIRVDIVPLSLILAQSAIESGWGSSRFTAEGNSLFGQWTWGENSIKPKQQRRELGDYGVAAFDSVLNSVKSYVHNLNSGRAYDDLREIRAKKRRLGELPRGKEMAEGLLKYSERGQEYVNEIKLIMRSNNLENADFAYLANNEETMFVFVD